MMAKRKRKIDFKKIWKFLPYVFAGGITIAIALVGSLNKQAAGTNLSLNALAASNYDNVSVAQLSGFYIVADVADAFGLASANDVASNYVTVTSLYESGQTSEGKIEKPAIPNIAVSRGVITYIVKDGETMDTIAARYGLTTDQIRWSNGLKTTAISAGDTLYLPSKPGIVYTVKSDDSLDSIASTYGSNVAEIVALNDLEISGISEGMRIIIRGGELPETERPEYVPPVRTYYYYSYSGSAYARSSIQEIGYMYGLGGPYVAGQCTQWAWYNRPDLPSNLGNANTWAVRAAAAGYYVDHNPTPGSIFQTSAGYYGHVGYVERVNGDGSVVVTEMNYTYRSFFVIRSVIPASAAGSFFYIH